MKNRFINRISGGSAKRMSVIALCFSIVIGAFLTTWGIMYSAGESDWPTDERYGKYEDGTTAVFEKSSIDTAADFVALAKASRNRDFEGVTFTIAQRDTISLSVVRDIGGKVDADQSFLGIGCEAYPFKGTILMENSADNTTLSLDGEWPVLFNNLSNEASIVSAANGGKLLYVSIDGPFSLCDTLTITKESYPLDISGFRYHSVQDSTVSSSKTAGLVAGRVKKTDAAAACSVDLSDAFASDCTYGMTSSGGDAGGLFGVIEQGVSLTAKVGTFNGSVSSDAGNAGVLAGVNNGIFTVEAADGGELSFSGAAAAEASSAAGLVGVNGEDAVLCLKSGTSVSALTVGGQYVGGIVGHNCANATLSAEGTVTVDGLQAAGGYAGGVIGLSDGVFTAAENTTVTVTGSTLASGGAASYLGGAIGRAASAPEGAFALSDNTFESSGTMGGFIGYLTADGDVDLGDVRVTSSVFNGVDCGDSDAVGGYFGTLTGTATVDLTVDAESDFTFNSVKNGFVGGVIGELSGTGDVTVGSMTLRSTFGNSGFSGTLGGAVGVVRTGTYLRLDGLSVTDKAEQIGDRIADLIGEGESDTRIDAHSITYKNDGNASVLVSRTGAGTVLRIYGEMRDESAQANHIVQTQYHSLLCVDGADFSFARPAVLIGNDVGNYGQVLRNDKLNILSFSDNSRAVSVSSPLTAALNLASPADAAKLAVTLHTEGRISGVAGYDASNYTELLGKSITLTGDIDLHGTGVEQFTCASEPTAFSGRFVGGGHTFTLAIGEDIGAADSRVKDLNNDRRYLGMFSSAEDAQFEALTVGGDLNFAADVPGNVYIGGLAGYGRGGITVSGCTTTFDVELSDGVFRGQKIYLYAGGFFGGLRDVTLSVTDSTVASVLRHDSGYGGNDDSNDKTNIVYLGGAAASLTTSENITFTGNTIKTRITKTPTVNYAHVGGCIADVTGTAYVDFDLTGTHADGASVSANAINTGGLIGHKYTMCRLTVDSDWQGTVANGINGDTIGGLIYRLSGKLTVKDSFSLGSSSFTTAADSVNKGCLVGDGREAIVEVFCGTDAFAQISADGFDRIAGYNIREYDSVGAGASGGIVTIETGGDIGALPTADSDWYTLIKDNSNTKTRYYFNISGLEKRAASETVSVPADLIYWNVYHYTNDSLPDYAHEYSYHAAVGSITGAAADVDMTDYSFYPSSLGSITFDFSGHTLTFGNTCFTDTDGNQLRALQTGVFSDITVSEKYATEVNFRNVQPAGTVFPVDGSSGVFICGRVKGTRSSSVTADAKVTVENVFFRSLTVDGTSTPLLINRIGSYVSCTITSVSQYTKQTYQTVSKENTYADAVKSAGSLIGQGGYTESDNTKSAYITVTFSNIVLAAENGSSLFRSATLFDSIDYEQGTGSFIYNFNLAEDWSGTTHRRAVTYGQEIYTNAEQQQYYDCDVYTSPVSGSASAAYAGFESGYMPYVRSNPTNLSVNRKSVNFDEGFGTYEHPYILSTSKQVAYLGRLLAIEGANKSTAQFSAGWRINYPRTSGSTVDYTQYDTYVADSDSKLQSDGKTLDSKTLLDYLCGAYFRIEIPSLVMEDGFTGLGTAGNPFHGVIAGSDTIITMPAYANVTQTGFGGFINAANGCAVYGLTISYPQIKLSGNRATTATSLHYATDAQTGTAHFGGVIGWVIGGDNRIERVSVTVDQVTAGHVTSVYGGYIGLVSAGGVFVSDLGDGALPGGIDAYANYYYYNPYVGKVLGGYVISTDKAYDNTEKNFTVPVVTSDLYAKHCSSGWVSTLYQYKLETPEDLLMLGFAMNNGALSYRSENLGYGKGALSRRGDYSRVGEIAAADVTAGLYKDDNTSGGKSVFATYFGIGNIADSHTYECELLFTSDSYDMSGYGNAFRGLGCAYSGAQCFAVQKVTGAAGGTTITVNTDIKQYYFGNAFEPDTMNNLALIYERSGGSATTFTSITMSGTMSLVHTDADGAEASSWHFYNKAICVGGFMGYSGRAYFNDVGIKDLTVRSTGWAGGLVASEEYYGDSNGKIVVNGCTVSGLTVEGKQSTGGLFGFLRLHGGSKASICDVDIDDSAMQVKTTDNPSITNDYDDIAVGAVVAYARRDGSEGLTLSDIRIAKTAVICLSSNTAYGRGNINAGGLVGRSTVGLTFDGCTLDGCVIYAGGAFESGRFPTEYGQSVDIAGSVYSDIGKGIANMLGYTDSGFQRDGNAGGLVARANCTVSVSNCAIKSDSATTVILGNRDTGGVVGSSGVTGECSISGFSITSGDGYPLYILAKDTVAGICPWNDNNTGARFTVSDAKISGNAAQRIYIVSARQTLYAGGYFGNVNNAVISMENIELSYCTIASDKAAGVVSSVTGSPLTFKNLCISDNILIGRSGSVAGVINTVPSGSTVTVDELYIGDNIFRHAGRSSNTGLIADTVSGKLQCYYVLTRSNDAAYSASAIDRADLLRGAALPAGTNYGNVGRIVYRNSGTCSVFALSSEDDEWIAQMKPFCQGSGTVMHAAYGAPTVYKTAHDTDEPLTPREAVEAVTNSAVLSDGELTLRSDPVTSAGGAFTPDHLKSLTWWETSARNAVVNLSPLSQYNDAMGITENRNGALPVLYINGRTDDTVRALLTRITNNAVDAFTMSASSQRYNISQDGTWQADADGKGSVQYVNGKFTAGTYDIFTEEKRTLTVLTVTYTADAEHTYSLDVVVYYPQILEIRTGITAAEGEVYYLPSFLGDNPPHKIDVSVGDIFTFYVQYAYNEAAEKVENYNFAKRIDSTQVGGTGQGTPFAAGTSFILIDLNSNDPSGYRYYKRQLTEDSTYLTFGEFTDVDSASFAPKELQALIADGFPTRYLDQNDDTFTATAVERYLVVLIPPTDGRNETHQYNLKAQVEENDKNIVVEERDTLGQISVWRSGDGSVTMERDRELFSNNVDGEMTADVTVTKVFEGGYLSAMANRTVYGTHVVRLTDAENHYVSLPAGTVVRFTDADGTVRLTERIFSPVSAVRYQVGNIIGAADQATKSYTDHFTVTFDFSAVSAQDFNAAFRGNQTYVLQETFYLSVNKDNYANGQKIVGSASFRTENITPVRLALVPTDRKHLAVNLSDPTDATNDGRIAFNLTADFSAIPDVTVNGVEVEFSVYKKVYDESSDTHRYELMNSDGFASVTYADEQPFDGALTVSDNTADGKFLLRLTLPEASNTNDPSGVLTNYRLVAKVTGTGVGADGATGVSYTATDYFVFLLCNADNQMDAE